MADVEGGLVAAVVLPTAGYFGKLAVDSFLAFRRRKRFCIRAIDALDVEIRGIVDSAKPIKDNLDQGLASGLIDQRIAENRQYAPYFPVARLSNAALAQVEKDISFLNRLSLQLVWDFYGLEALLVEQVVDTTRENFRNLEPGRKKTAIAHISSTIEELIRTGHQAQECLAHHRRDIEGERWLCPNWI